VIAFRSSFQVIAIASRKEEIVFILKIVPEIDQVSAIIKTEFCSGKEIHLEQLLD